MKGETRLWLKYAEENFRSAEVLLKSHLYNPVLQNVHQSIEKYLKALFIEYKIGLTKTHNIAWLLQRLKETGIEIAANADTIDMIDSIYLTSRYPIGSVLPDFHPDEHLCRTLLKAAADIRNEVLQYVNTKG